VDWQIEDQMRCDLVGFTKPSFAGTRHVVQIFPSGRQGDLPDSLSSLIVIAPIGTRLVLVTNRIGAYNDYAWRCIQLVKDHAFKTKEGHFAVRVPDLDMLDAPKALRTDLDFEQTFDLAADLESGTGWTFGQPGTIKERVVKIHVERVP